MTNLAHDLALATDLYQMTMGASYYARGIDEPATFSLFVRRLPSDRSYLVAAGLEEAIERLVNLRFDEAALDYLRSIGQVREDFIDSLASFRFSGDVLAVPEGRVVFANEPLIEVRAPMIEAQLAETLLLNAVHFPTLVASKAARCVTAAQDKPLVEFGLRRTPSIDAGVAVARAAYLAGFAGTSNLLAGDLYHIPVSGTVAHSFIQIFANELDAFRAFAETYPGPVTLLIDTYDTAHGARQAARVAKEIAQRGGRVAFVRIDSGDLAQVSREVRRILDAEGLPDVQIIVSGGLDEFDIADLVRSGAPIDAFGIGTRLGTVADTPALDMVYKLVEFDGRPVMKLSPGKMTLAGPKQVWRRLGNDGCYAEDLIALREESAPGSDWQPLLAPVVTEGKPAPRPSLQEVRTAHRDEMTRLSERLLALSGTAAYPVRLSARLEEQQRVLSAAIRERETS